jgi:UDP-glucuronate decarboxylase
MHNKKYYYNRLIDQLNSINLSKLKKKEYNIFNNSKILITGASGLIGINLLFFFNKLSKEKKLSIYVDGTYNTSIFNFVKLFFKENKEVNFYKIDLTTKNISKDKKYDFIFHFAGYGQPSKFIRNSISTYSLNSTVVSQLQNNLKKDGKFIYLSTSEIYSGNHKTCNENSIGFTGPFHPRSIYIDSKKFGESFIVNTCSNFLIFRVSLTYGHGVKMNDERALNQVIMRSIFKKEINVYGGLKQLRSNLFIDDTILMIIKSISKSKNQIFNLNNHKLDFLDKTFKLIAKISNKRINYQPAKITGSPNVIKISNLKILKLLDYKISIGLKEGIEKTRKWYINLDKYYKF